MGHVSSAPRIVERKGDIPDAPFEDLVPKPEPDPARKEED